MFANDYPFVEWSETHSSIATLPHIATSDLRCQPIKSPMGYFICYAYLHRIVAFCFRENSATERGQPFADVVHIYSRDYIDNYIAKLKGPSLFWYESKPVTKSLLEDQQWRAEPNLLKPQCNTHNVRHQLQLPSCRTPVSTAIPWSHPMGSWK